MIVFLIIFAFPIRFTISIIHENLNLEYCKKSDLPSENCGLQNFKKVMKFIFTSVHDINGSEILLDPFYKENLLLMGELAEAFQFTIHGLSNFHIDELLVSKDEHEDSFLIASKVFMPWINGSGDYRLNWKLGLFSFNANGEFYCEACIFEIL
jgi:hypothetical protein